MINIAKAKQLITDATAGYEAMLSSGDWRPLQFACGEDECSGEMQIYNACLCAVAKTRNPSPLMDIPDFRHLISKTRTGSVTNSGAGLMVFFIAVIQGMQTNCVD